MAPRFERLRARFRHELVTQPTYRQHVARLGRLVLDISAQTYYEIIDRTRVGVLVQSPDLFQDFLAGNRTAAVADEVTQEIGLHERELEYLFAGPQLKFFEVNRLAVETKNFGRSRACCGEA